MTHSTAPLLSHTTLTIPPARRTTLWLMLGLVTITVATGWFINERVFTRDIFHQLLDTRLDTNRVDAQFDTLRQIQMWGYLVTPLTLLVRLTVVALTVQLFLLLTKEVSFRKVFLATAWAQLAVCAGGIERAVYLAFLPRADISQGTMSVMPGSLSSILFYPQDFQRPLYAILSLVSVFEFTWCAILFIALRQCAGVERRTALGATAGTWILLATLQGAVSWFLAAAA